MNQVGTDALVESYWSRADGDLAGLSGDAHGRLNVAVAAVDTVWDRHVFDRAETFGGPEIGFARVLSGAILARLLGLDLAALVSVAGGEIPPTGNEVLDRGLASARQEALDTFSNELLGPVDLEGLRVCAQPMLLDSPIPIGAAVLAGKHTLDPEHEQMLRGFLAHFDTRLNLAEQLLKLRREKNELDFELRKYRGETEKSEPAAVRRRAALPDEVAASLGKLAEVVPALELFGVPLATRYFEDFCRTLEELTDAYLGILDRAPNLFLDVPNGVDAKSGSRHAVPYHRLLEIMGRLRKGAAFLALTTAEDLLPYSAGGRTPTFADITRVAKTRVSDETLRTILDIMNDQGEELELDAVASRHHPYEFRAANTGEVFALLALFRTLKANEPAALERHTGTILRALPRYQAARAYLFSYDRFEDVPLKGVDRTQPPAAESLLLLREKAPSFGLLMRAFQG
jgi:hypothetical protein